MKRVIEKRKSSKAQKPRRKPGSKPQPGESPLSPASVTTTAATGATLPPVRVAIYNSRGGLRKVVSIVDPRAVFCREYESLATSEKAVPIEQQRETVFTETNYDRPEEERERRRDKLLQEITGANELPPIFAAVLIDGASQRIFYMGSREACKQWAGGWNKDEDATKPTGLRAAVVPITYVVGFAKGGAT